MVITNRQLQLTEKPIKIDFLNKFFLDDSNMRSAFSYSVYWPLVRPDLKLNALTFNKSDNIKKS